MCMFSGERFVGLDMRPLVVINRHEFR
jgi:hypothetical protein